MNSNYFDDFKRAWYKPNNAIIQIILINIIVFAIARVLKVFFDLSGATDIFFTLFSILELPADIGQFILQPWSIVTYFFTHYEFFHLLFNMLFVYWFGQIILEFLGNKRVIELYVLGGLFGGILYIFLYNFIPFYTTRVDGSLMLGASAGVFSIVVGAAVLRPDYSIFFIFLGPVKIKYIAIFYVFMSFIQSTGENAGGEIAHLGGAFAGWLFITQLSKGNDIGDWISQFIDRVKNLFSSQSQIKVIHRKKQCRKPAKSMKTSVNKQGTIPDQGEIDAILDKISSSGYESLSKEEKQKLFNASKK